MHVFDRLYVWKAFTEKRKRITRRMRLEEVKWNRLSSLRSHFRGKKTATKPTIAIFNWKRVETVLNASICSHENHNKNKWLYQQPTSLSIWVRVNSICFDALSHRMSFSTTFLPISFWSVHLLFGSSVVVVVVFFSFVVLLKPLSQANQERMTRQQQQQQH